MHGAPECAVLQTALPADLNHADRQTRAAQEYSTQVQARYDAIRPRLRAGAALEATLANGELAFLVDGVSVIDRVFVTEAEGAFFLAQWKLLASTLSLSDKTTGKALCDALARRLLHQPGACRPGH